MSETSSTDRTIMINGEMKTAENAKTKQRRIG
jgi:hypothetical protein